MRFTRIATLLLGKQDVAGIAMSSSMLTT